MLYFTIKDPELVEHEKKVSVLDLLKIRQLWPLFPLITFSYAIPAGIRGLWSGPYLEQVHGLDIVEIGRIVLYMSLAQIVGTLVYGPMDRLFNTRKWVVVCGNVVMLISCFWLATNGNASLAGITIAFIVIGIFGSATTVQAAHGKAFIPVHMIGRGMTLLNFFSIGGTALMQFLSGGIFNAWSVPGNPSVGYNALFFFYATLLAMAIVIYLLSSDVKPRQN